jgi:hypothetical protein
MKLTGLLLGVMISATGCSMMNAASTSDANINEEGLVPINVKGLDHVYARPGANLAPYTKVMLDPVEVSFSKDWPSDSSVQRITPEYRQRVKESLAKILRKELAKELAASGRYTLVDKPADGVLRIKADIRDLYINAPDLQTAGFTETYTLSAGHMRLVAELRDAPTGELIARVIDYKEDPDSPWLQLTTSIDNAAAAERAADDWARILRRQLDAARGIKS